MTNEQILTDFMQKHYTDERLSWLLAHAESGKLAYVSCCCFIGVATADHALVADGQIGNWGDHLNDARMLEGGFAAEGAYLFLATDAEEKSVAMREAERRGDYTAAGRIADELRRKALIPLIRAEIARRERERSESSSESPPAETVLSV